MIKQSCEQLNEMHQNFNNSKITGGEKINKKKRRKITQRRQNRLKNVVFWSILLLFVVVVYTGMTMRNNSFVILTEMHEENGNNEIHDNEKIWCTVISLLPVIVVFVFFSFQFFCFLFFSFSFVYSRFSGENTRTIRLNVAETFYLLIYRHHK